MAQRYIEVRNGAAKGAESIAADIMRHLHTRQHLGKAVVVYEQPAGMLSAARKQWLRLARSLQKQRAATLNADKILKYSHAITRMQHMGFSAKTPLLNPEASVYFLRPEELHVMPMLCYSFYVLAPLSDGVLHATLSQLPSEALVVDYTGQIAAAEFELLTKNRLEAHVASVWGEVEDYLHEHTIDPRMLVQSGVHDIEFMDNALDTLLGRSHQFLRLADEFQRALELARPLDIPRGVRELYDSLILLAHRVQALSPGAFTHHFLEAYNEDDTFLYDTARGRFKGTGETLSEAYERHVGAGRLALARALLQAFGDNTRVQSKHNSHNHRP